MKRSLFLLLILLISISSASAAVVFTDYGGTNNTNCGADWIRWSGVATDCKYTDFVKYGSQNAIQVTYSSGDRNGAQYNLDNITFPFWASALMWDDNSSSAYHHEVLVGQYGIYHNHLHRDTIHNTDCVNQYKYTKPNTGGENCTQVYKIPNAWINMTFHFYNWTWAEYYINRTLVFNGSVQDIGSPRTLILSHWDNGGGGTTPAYYANVIVWTEGNETSPEPPADSCGTTAGTNATGGTMSTAGGYTVHVFNSNATLNLSSALDVEILLVGGGGGGALAGGGGGAGGVLYNTSLKLVPGSYNISVGSGGIAGSDPGNGTVSLIKNTSGTILTAYGGGRGGQNNQDGHSGASGGGGGTSGGSARIGGSAIYGAQGNNGGNTGVTTSPYPAGGGGGASTAGVTPSTNTKAGDGGNGTLYNLTGTPTYYGGGGGGGLYSAGGAAGVGGLGGGGNGSVASAAATAGVANTGGGGGGSGSGGTAGAGGSGVVIIRYIATTAANCTTQTPSFVSPTPADGATNNTQVIINVSCGIGTNRTFLYFDNNTNPTTLAINNNTVGTFYTGENISTNYYYKAQCWTASGGYSSNSTTRRWTYDIINSTISINPSNQFKTNNLSSRLAYGGTAFLNLSLSDNDAISAFIINITQGTTIKYNETNTSVNTKSVNYTKTLTTTTWGAGRYNISITVTDNTTKNTYSERYTFYVGNYSYNNPGEALALNPINLYALFSRDALQDRINATLTYSGVNYTPTITISGDVINFSVDLLAANSTSNATYLWSVDFVEADLNTTSLNLSGNHSVTSWSLTACGTTPTINLSQFYEDTPTSLLSGVLELEIYYWASDPAYKKLYNNSYASASSFSVCLSPSTATLQADIYAKNTVTGGFTHRFYIQNGTYTNATTYYNIFNVNDTTGYTDLKLTARKISDYSYFNNVLAQLQRKYLSEGVWRTVQMDKTGDYGLLFFDIKEENTDYRLLFYDEYNNLLKQTESLKFVCTSGVCDLTQLLNPAGTTTAVINGTASATYDNSTKVITINWASEQASGSTVTIKVNKEAFSSTTNICTTAQSGTSGSYSCNVSLYTGALQVLVTMDGENKLSEWVEVNRPVISDFISNAEESVITFLLMLAIVAFGLFSPVALVASGIFGLIVVFYLGLFSPLTITFLMIASIIGLVIGAKVKN